MKSILSGTLIGIGGTIYLSLYENSKVIGALLFCIGLISICYFQLPLFTGKVGYFIKKEVTFWDLIYGILAGNIIGATLTGILIGVAKPELHQIASTIVENKHQLSYLIVGVNSIFCGLLMYIAVDIFKSKKTTIGILFAIPVFILAGFEHSIAYCFYAGVAFNIDLLFLIISIIGNSLGSFIIPLIEKYEKR